MGGCTANPSDADVTDVSKTADVSESGGEDTTVNEEIVELTVWRPYSSTIIQSLSDSFSYQELETKTNVKITYIHPTVGQEQEAFNLMIASGELPDIIMAAPAYPGGDDKAVADGIYLRLNEIIDQYSPNYKRIRELYPEIAKETITDEGNIVSYSSVQIGEEAAWRGLVIRQDWLDKLNLDIPVTIEDWYNVLTAFKNELNVEIPLIFNGYPNDSGSGFDNSGAIISAYGTLTEFIQKDGVVSYGFMEEGYKDFLMEMNKWYEEGLLDIDFATRNNDANVALFTSGKAGAIFRNYGDFQNDEIAGRTIDPDFRITPVANPLLTEGSTNYLRMINPHNKGASGMITTSCENIEAAARFLDYGYSDEGFLLFNYGIEDVAYTWAEGVFDELSQPFLPETFRTYTEHPEFTELLTNNPDDYSFSDLAYIYRIDLAPGVRNPMANSIDDLKKLAMEEWTKDEADWVMPIVSLTDAEKRIESMKMTDIKAYVLEMSYKFIMGKESLDGFEAYVEQIKKIGIDEVIAVKQAALERYNSR